MWKSPTRRNKFFSYITLALFIFQSFYPIIGLTRHLPEVVAQAEPSATPTPTPDIEPTATPTPTPSDDKIDICHATASDTNPYNKISVNQSAIDGDGSSDHNRDTHQDGEDIIPPGTWDADGRNWDETGQAIYNNDCNIPDPTPTENPTPTVEPTTSPSPTPTVTPSKETIPLGEKNVCQEGVLFTIGDEEALQTDNPVDEMNWPGLFGVFPPYDSPFIVDSADPDSSTYPWNSNSSSNEATDFDVDFEYQGTAATARVTLSWSPGKSGAEEKEVLFDGTSLGSTPVRIGSSVAGWWNNMQIVQDTFDFYLEPGEHTLNFKHLQGDGTLWDYVKVEIIECERQCVEGPTWATFSGDVNQGTRKDGSAVSADRSDPGNALGEPDSKFFSLGFGGVLTVMFDHAVSNVDGVDLSFHETTNGRYPLETAEVEVSQDGIVWDLIGQVDNQTNGGINYLDFGSTGLSWIKYVRLTDTSDANIHSNNADGYDINSIDATYGLCSDPEPDQRNVCGDNILEKPEQCDDGNLTNGDGCSSSCQWEPSCRLDQNMIHNGGFEEPIVTHSKKWDIFQKPTLPAWNVNWVSTTPSSYGGTDRPENAFLELHRGVNGWLPLGGQQYAELDSDWGGPNTSLSGEPASTTIYQDIPTIPGEEYTVTYNFSPRPKTSSGDNLLALKINGTTVQTVGGAGGNNTSWTEYSHTFTASTTPTRIEFVDLGTSNSLGTFIDDVSAYCQPKTTIEGYKYNDRNSNGTRERDEEGLEGWEIVLKAQSQEPVESLVIDSSDANGETTTTSLESGKKYLIEVEGVWFNFINNRRAVDADYYSDDSWGTINDLDSDNTRDPRQLDVVIDDTDIDWSSYNSNHLYKTIIDGADAPINVRVFDQDNASNPTDWYGDNTGSLNVRIYEVSETATTDTNGYYSFDVKPGEYQVIEVMQADWTQTAPAGPSYCHIVGQLGGTYECTFGNHYTPTTFNLRACKANDIDFNLQTTDDWTRVQGWTLKLYQDDQLVDTQETSQNGCYDWNRLEGGHDYTVVEEERDGWTALTEISHNIDPILGETYEHTFVNSQLGRIQGRKYNDLNQNGSRQGGESRLNGWTIRLYDNDWNFLGEQTTGHTGTTGQYRFTNLKPGRYYTCEVQQDGWSQTQPLVGFANGSGALDEAARCQRSNINRSGKSVTGKSFGNYEEPAEPTPTEAPTPTPTPEPGVLSIQKSNNSFPTTETPGGTVTYTIIVTVSEGSFFQVSVTDLPPGDFTYIPGSWTAESSTRGDLVTLGVTTEPTYASPGDWILGAMESGEVVTLTYQAKIGGAADPGFYPDLAWAQGEQEAEEGTETVLALAEATGYVDVNFVGTGVQVADTSSPNTSTNIEKERVDGSVLGATSDGSVLGASTLPATGAHTIWMALAALLTTFGGILVFTGYGIKKGYTLSLSKIAKAFSLVALLTLLTLGLGAQTAYAGSVSVRMEEPESPTNNGNFKLNFVALDTEARTMSVTCYKKGPLDAGFTAFGAALSLQSGGDDEYCSVNSSVVNENGIYEFKVVATAGADSATSSTVTVDFSSEKPGTPRNYNKSGQGCGYKIKAKTDDDGRTSRVEIYRSDETSFSANNGSRVTTVTVGPNTDFEYVDTIPDCGKKYYYVMRAFDDYDNGSGIVGDEIVKIISSGTSIQVTSSTTGSTGSVGGAGAIAVQANESQVEDGETTDGDSSENASDEEANEEITDPEVLGASDEQSGNFITKLLNNTLAKIAAILLLVLLILGYVFKRRNR